SSLFFLYSLHREIGENIKLFSSSTAQQQEKSSDSPDLDSKMQLANATFVILARNWEVDGVVRSIQNIEDRFNAGRYPFVLLNDEAFSDEFKRRVSIMTPARVEFGVIPKEQWNQPSWIDEEKASKARETMKAQKVKYGDNVQYRNMCRFNSGFFFKHDLLRKYKWYWRIEPDVKFHCDIKTDPFLFMEENDKVYSFTIAVYEIAATIPSLWDHVRAFIDDHPEYIAENNSMSFLSNNHGITYNLCHFWSNFEIADMDFWRGPAYTAFFEYLDSKGGFYYEVRAPTSFLPHAHHLTISVGEMPPSTASPPVCSFEKIKYTFLRKLVTNMMIGVTALYETKYGRRGGVLAIKAIALPPSPPCVEISDRLITHSIIHSLTSLSIVARPAPKNMTDPLPYNLTIPSQTASLYYYPPRGANSTASNGWELWYSAIDPPDWRRQGKGADFHKSTKAGAFVTFNWLGTAIYVYGTGTRESYKFSVDGQDIGQTFDVQQGGLLGSMTGMEYKEHSATLKVVGGEGLSLQYADLTIGLGYPGNENKNTTIQAVVEEGGSIQPNPFFVFHNDSLRWETDLRTASDLRNQHLAQHSVPLPNGTLTPITRQMRTDGPNDRLTFTVNSTSAFILWGSLWQDHYPKRVTISPDPRPNDSGAPKSTDMYDVSQYFDYQQVLYWESGLDRNKEYTVEVSNIVSRSDPMLFAFNELQFLDGGPSPAVVPVSSVPPESEPTGLVVAHDNRLATKYIAVIAVLSIFLVVAVGAGAFWFRRRAKQNREASVAYNYNGVLDNEPSSRPLATPTTSQSLREIDAGPLPPQYDHSWASVPTGEESEASGATVQTNEVAQNDARKWREWTD
ncbi:hypothetical protein PQX77_015199, partial [Marasmius sp. AFHP31]